MKRIMNMKNFFASSAWRLGGAVRRAATALLLCVMTMTVQTAWAETVTTYYVDENGTRHDVNATVLTGTGTLSSDQWYVVNSNVTIDNSTDRISSTGNIKLILADGKTFTISSNNINGIINTNYGTVSIYGQEDGTGTLNVAATGNSGIAIYGYTGVNIVGCHITATSTGATGISSGGNITISGGQVSATGGNGYYGLRTHETITLGWRKTTDHVYANSYFYLGNVKVKNGQAFKDSNGNIYVGTLDKNQIKGKTLQPATQTEYIQYCLGTGNDGSAEHPYTINDANGWNAFCLALDDNATWNHFSGKTVKLGANITVTQMAGGQPFTGIFDGDGHTLTLNYGTADAPVDAQFVAPFVATSSDGNHQPVFRNLTIDGTIYDSYSGSEAHNVGGLIGHLYGDVTIEHCTSNLTITSVGGAGGFVGLCEHTAMFTDCVSSTAITSPGGNNSGFVSWSRASGHAISFEGCVFNGKLLQQNGNGASNGCFIGWTGSNKTVTFTNCLCAPAATTSGETMATGNSATFARGWNATTTATNSYYTQDFNDGEHNTGQGKQLRTIAAGENVSIAHAGVATVYDVSGITAYKATAQGTTFIPGLLYNNNVHYAGSGEAVSLTLTNTPPTGYTLDSYTASPDGATLSEDGDNYTLTMPDANVTITATFIELTPVSVSYIDGKGVEQTVDAIPLMGTETNLGSYGKTTWYVVNSDITYTGTVTLSGDVHLILMDNAVMNVGTEESPINGHGISCDNSSISIYAQSMGESQGQLHTSTYYYGIHAGNSITINGGQVTANIIDAINGVTINGGQVTANSINAIYGVTINGGQVTANNINTVHGSIFFSWSNASDFILAYGYSQYYNSFIAKAFITEEGDIYTSGELTSEQLEAIAGQRLHPTVPYLDESGETRYCTEFTLLTGSETSLSSGWYIAQNNVDGVDLAYTDGLECESGHINIILADGAEMTVTNQIYEDAIEMNSVGQLTFYGQTLGTGSLTITGSEQGRCIHARKCDLVVNGGVINATATTGNAVECYNFTMNGGTFSATTTYDDGYGWTYAIQLGSENDATFTYSGGLFSAISTYGTGIEGYWSPTYISWNNVSDSFYVSSFGQVNVIINEGTYFIGDDGDVYSSGNPSIGGVHLRPACSVTMADVIASPNIIGQDGNNYAACGADITLAPAPGYGNLHNVTFTPEGGSATQPTNNGDGTYSFTMPAVSVAVAGEATVITYSITYHGIENATFQTENYSYTVESDDITLDQPTRDGFVFAGWYAAADFSGSPVATIEQGSTGDLDLYARWNVPYIAADGTAQTCTEFTTLTGSETELGTAGQETWYVTDGTLNYGQTITISGNVHLILKDNAVMNVGTEETPVNGNGIYSEGHSISIYAQSMGESQGQLHLNVNADDPAQYSGIKAENSSITINGGEVEAIGASGIYAENSSVNINSGKVKAFGSNGGGIIVENDNVTINGGQMSANNIIALDGSITINGGQVTANDINANGGSVTINGGQVTVNSIVAYVGNITLGWSNASDFIYANNYYVNNGTLSIAEGKTFIDEDGNTFESGTVDASAIDRKTLYPYIEGSVPYIDGNGQQQLCIDYNVLNGTETTLGTSGQETWYVVDGTLNYSQTITISGNVHLILKDNAVMNVGTEETPINGHGISCVNSSISIYAQSMGESQGQLHLNTNVESSSDHYGIRAENSGSITINGGEVEATGKTGIYAINDATVNINRGKVTAKGTSYYGIFAQDNSITINGGQVTANGGLRGIFANSGSVTINGGQVTAHGNIFGIHAYKGGSVTINGGQVTANGQIGIYASDGNITLGWSHGSNFIFASSYDEDFGRITIANNKTFITEDGSTYTSGQLNGDQLAAISDKTLYPYIEGSVPYIDENGQRQLCTEYNVLNGNETTLGTSGQETWYVVDGTLNYSQTIYLSGDVHLILKDNAVMNVGTEETPVNGNGIYCPNSSISIYAQSMGESQGQLHLNVNADDEVNQYCGIIALDSSITINGAKVSASGYSGIFGVNAPININGGQVTVDGSGWGIYGDGNNININGGQVTANGGRYGIQTEGGNITLGWTNATDYIRASSYEGTVNIASGQTLYDEDNTPYSGTISWNETTYTYPINGKTLRPLTNVLVLNDDADNSAAIAAAAVPGASPSGTNVILQGRKLWKDGAWNTLVLPFDVTVGSGQMAGATAMTMNAAQSGFDSASGLLTLYFDGVGEGSTIAAGTPFIVKWTGNAGQFVENPMFSGVTIDLDSPSGAGGAITFRGTYNVMTFDAADPNGVLLEEGSNTLKYAASGDYLGACRAYFVVDPTAAGEGQTGARPTDYILHLGSLGLLEGSFNQRGDANGDGSISVTDIAVVVNCILQLTNNGGFSVYGADANGDGDITVTDIGVIVDLILGTSGNAASRRLTHDAPEPQ